MALYRELLSRPRLSVISAEPDHELEDMARTITPSVRVDGRAELEHLFDRLLAASRRGDAVIAPKTLDLLGHSTARTALFRLGGWVIDAGDPTVTACFRWLAEHDVLPRLGIHAVRLLACHTASTPEARATICALADLLGVEVHGANGLLYDAHHDEHGFREAWRFLLVGSSELRRRARAAEAEAEAEHWPDPLDLDRLPGAPLEPRTASWPTRLATPHAARQILGLIDRGAGGRMPGLAGPSCALALPAAAAGAYHVAQVLLDGAFVRFHPGGTSVPGLVYPVRDPCQLRRIVEALPVIGLDRVRQHDAPPRSPRLGDSMSALDVELDDDARP